MAQTRQTMEEHKTMVLSNIRNMRKERGLNQENMAFELGISTQWYQQLEKGTGNICLEYLLRIAEVLEVPVCSLFFFDEHPKDEYYYRIWNKLTKNI